MEKAKRMERIKGRLKFWFLTCERKTIFWLGTLSFAIIASFISLLVANSFLSKTPETYEVGEITNFVKKSHANGEDIELPSGAFVNFRDEQKIVVTKPGYKVQVIGEKKEDGKYYLNINTTHLSAPVQMLVITLFF